jgi:hypothetical protein
VPPAEDLAELRDRVRRSGRRRNAVRVTALLAALVIGALAIGLPGGESRDGGRLILEVVVFGVVPVIAEAVAVWLMDRRIRPGVTTYLSALLASRQGRLTLRIDESVTTQLGQTLGWLIVVSILLAGLSREQQLSILLLALLLLLVAVAEGSARLTDNRYGLKRRPFEQLDASPDGLDWWGPHGEHERLRWVAVQRVVTRRGPRGERTDVLTIAGERHRVPTSYVEPDSNESLDLQTIIEVMRPGVFRRQRRFGVFDALTDLVPGGSGWA